VRIREASAADLDSVFAVNKTSALAAYGHIFEGEAFPDDRVRERLRRLLATEELTVLLAEEEDVATGFIVFAPGWIEALYVMPESWRRGIGSSLLQAAAPVLGSRAVALWVLRDNERGRRFWEKHGFSPDGAEKEDLFGHVELRYARSQTS